MVGARGSGTLLWNCVSYTSKATLVATAAKAQQLGRLNVSWTRRTPISLQEESPGGLSLTQRTAGNQAKLGEDVALSKESHTTQLSTVKLSTLKMQIQVTLYGHNMLYLNICVCIYKYIYACSNNWEAMHLKESWGWRVMGGFGGKKQRENVAI